MATTNSKIKPVHFNLDNPNDLELFNKACKISNFTKWVKDCLSEGIGLKEESVVSKDDIRDVIKEILNDEYLDRGMEKIVVQEKVKEEMNTPPKIEQTEETNELDSMIL